MFRSNESCANCIHDDEFHQANVLRERPNHLSTILSLGRMIQKYAVDVSAGVEDNALSFLSSDTGQNMIRAANYQPLNFLEKNCSWY